MKNKIISVFAGIVCVFSTIVVTFSIGSGIFSILQYISPIKHMNAVTASRTSSNDIYWNYLEESKAVIATKGRPSEDDLSNRRKIWRESSLLEIKNNARDEIFKNVIYGLLFTILGCVSWKLLRRYSPES